MAYELIKVSELPELTTPSNPNVIPIQDGDYLKRVSFQDLKEAIGGDIERAVQDEAQERENADNAIMADLAAEYDATATYAVGDYVIYEGQLYRCTTAITTAEAWTASHWTAVNMGDEVGDLKNALNNSIKYDLPIDIGVNRYVYEGTVVESTHTKRASSPVYPPVAKKATIIAQNGYSFDVNKYTANGGWVRVISSAVNATCDLSDALAWFVQILSGTDIPSDTHLVDCYFDMDDEIKTVREMFSSQNLMGNDASVYYPIRLVRGQKLTISTSDGSNFPTDTGLRIVLYDENKSQVDYFSLANDTPSRTVTLGSNKNACYYAMWNKTPHVPLMVVYGDTAENYVEYFNLGAEIAKIDSNVKSLETNIKTVLAENFGIEQTTVVNGFDATNASNSSPSLSPFVLDQNVSGLLITGIKINVNTTGTLSVGYYKDTPVRGSAYDPAKEVVVNTLTLTSLGIMDVILPTSFVVPEGCRLMIGTSIDTAVFKYGSNGTDTGFCYIGTTGTTFTKSNNSLGVDVIGYTESDVYEKISENTDSIEILKDYTFGSETLLNGYSELNATNGTFTTSPFVIRKDFGADCLITDVVMPVRGAGTVTFGTIKKTDVTSGVTYDATKLKPYKTLKVTATGVQTIHIGNMIVLKDEYVFYGMPSDTALHIYGENGNDKGFFYVSGGVYVSSAASVNINLIGSKLVSTTSSTYKGKTISILGDSISTFSGYIPEGNATYYPSGTVTVVTDTWWKKLIDALGMELDVNNSWSGSRVTTTGGDASAGCMTRCEALGTSPDVIIVWMGINDFNNEVALGTYDGASAIPQTTTTFREAYGIMLNKILTKYQTSEVWVCTLPQCERNGTEGFPEINGNNVALVQFNKAIEELAQAFGVKVLDHNRCGLTYQNMDIYNPDELHPNKFGHSLVANNDIRQMDAAVRTRYSLT